MASPRISLHRPGVALIGGGFIGQVHAEALRRLSIPVVGLLSSEAGRARPVAERLGIARVYSDLAELLADPAVGSVHITSPNTYHKQQAMACLEAGRHVICEKPLAISSRETQELVEAAASRPDLRHAVCYNIRFYPICLEMRARIDRGDLGRIVAIQGSYTQDWLSRVDDYNWRVEPDSQTNLRAVADIGTHWMDLAQFISGRSIVEVMADLNIVHPTRRKPTGAVATFGAAESGQTEDVPIQTEDQASILFGMTDQIRGAFQVSQVFPGRKNRLAIEIVGVEGSMCWDSEEPNSLRIGRRDRPNEHLIRDPALLSPEAAARSNYPGGHAEGFPDTFVGLFRAFYESMAGGPREYPDFADGHREVELCEAIASSHRDRRWVELPGKSNRAL